MQTDRKREKAKIYRQSRKEHYAKLNSEWIKNNKDKYNASKAKYRIKLKRECMLLYANPVACKVCGFSCLDGLVLDHINNDGAAHRKQENLSSRGSDKSGITIYELIRKRGKIEGLQVLCANCNMIKHVRLCREKSIKDKELIERVEKEIYGELHNS